MRWIPLLMAVPAVAALSAGCTGGDSTVSKTPTNTLVGTAQPTAPAPPPPPPVDNCAVNLKDPAIAAAVAVLPPAPNSEATWKPVPLGGNYNKCSAISAVIVAENTHEPNPGTRAVFFHEGNPVVSGVPNTYGYTAVDLNASTQDTVVLKFSNGIPGLDSTVGFHWNGTGIVVAHNPPPQ